MLREVFGRYGRFRKGLRRQAPGSGQNRNDQRFYRRLVPGFQSFSTCGVYVGFDDHRTLGKKKRALAWHCRLAGLYGASPEGQAGGRVPALAPANQPQSGQGNYSQRGTSTCQSSRFGHPRARHYGQPCAAGHHPCNIAASSQERSRGSQAGRRPPANTPTVPIATNAPPR